MRAHPRGVGGVLLGLGHLRNTTNIVQGMSDGLDRVVNQARVKYLEIQRILIQSVQLISSMSLGQDLSTLIIRFQAELPRF